MLSYKIIHCKHYPQHKVILARITYRLNSTMMWPGSFALFLYQKLLSIRNSIIFFSSRIMLCGSFALFLYRKLHSLRNGIKFFEVYAKQNTSRLNKNMVVGWVVVKKSRPTNFVSSPSSTSLYNVHILYPYKDFLMHIEVVTPMSACITLPEDKPWRFIMKWTKNHIKGIH